MQFGVDVLHVQEVIRYQQITPVPLAPESIVGLINLRGQIVTAVDMRRLLNLPPSRSSEPPMNVVLTSQHGACSLLVDAIGDVVEYDEQLLEPPPDTLDPATKHLVHAVCKLRGELLMILNTASIAGAGASSVHSAA
jgi:purine-binding chemotaxis protein CheW